MKSFRMEHIIGAEDISRDYPTTTSTSLTSTTYSPTSTKKVNTALQKATTTAYLNASHPSKHITGNTCYNPPIIPHHHQPISIFHTSQFFPQFLSLHPSFPHHNTPTRLTSLVNRDHTHPSFPQQVKNESHFEGLFKNEKFLRENFWSHLARFQPTDHKNISQMYPLMKGLGNFKRFVDEDNNFLGTINNKVDNEQNVEGMDFKDGVHKLPSSKTGGTFHLVLFQKFLTICF